MIGALVVTHGNVAEEIIKAATRIFGDGCKLRPVCIGWDENVVDARRKIVDAIQEVDAEDGVLIMTDMFGGTASNLSLTLLDPGKIEVVTGVNLSMLLKFANAAPRVRSLGELAEVVCHRGRESIQIPSRALRSKSPEGEDTPPDRKGDG
ncbi:MAG: PTS sugar transporter subunit IIA [Acidobacteriota bacterium]